MRCRRASPAGRPQAAPGGRCPPGRPHLPRGPARRGRAGAGAEPGEAGAGGARVRGQAARCEARGALDSCRLLSFLSRPLPLSTPRLCSTEAPCGDPFALGLDSGEAPRLPPPHHHHHSCRLSVRVGEDHRTGAPPSLLSGWPRRFGAPRLEGCGSNARTCLRAPYPLSFGRLCLVEPVELFGTRPAAGKAERSLGTLVAQPCHGAGLLELPKGEIQGKVEVLRCVGIFFPLAGCVSEKIAVGVVLPLASLMVITDYSNLKYSENIKRMKLRNRGDEFESPVPVPFGICD